MGNVKELNTSEFDAEVIKSTQPVLVDFWAPWCGPCRMVSPVVESIAGKFSETLKTYKVNTDENPDVASKFGIQAIPTLMVFKGGQVVERVVGFKPEAELTRIVEKHIG